MRPLTVVLTVDPEIPVPPEHYGGIERIVDLIIHRLMARGHSVHLLAHRDSSVEATLWPWPGGSSRKVFDTLSNAVALRRAVRDVGRVDIVHSFSRLAYLGGVLFTDVPKVQSYQRHIAPSRVRWARKLANGTLAFTACSQACAATAPEPGVNWRVIYNGVPLARFDFRGDVAKDAPLLFLGRVESIKGPDVAIRVAKRAGRRLVIAGNRAETGAERAYFDREIAPHCDGVAVRYVGPVDDGEKNRLLGSASALLFPIDWEEPFGIVMAEALACGTPIVAFRRGAVSEVVRHGQTGFVCGAEEEMVTAVGRLSEIDRAVCRADCEARFSDDVIVSQYESLYYEMVAP